MGNTLSSSINLNFSSYFPFFSLSKQAYSHVYIIAGVMKMEYTNLGLILALRRAQGLQLWPAPIEEEWGGEQLLVS